MRNFSQFSLFTALMLVANQTIAGVNQSPGSEFGVGSIGLIALGFSSVAYVTVQRQKQKVKARVFSVG